MLYFRGSIGVCLVFKFEGDDFYWRVNVGTAEYRDLLENGVPQSKTLLEGVSWCKEVAVTTRIPLKNILYWDGNCGKYVEEKEHPLYEQSQIIQKYTRRQVC